MKKRIFDSTGFNVEKLPHFFHTLYPLFTVLDFSFNSNVTVSSVAHVSFCQIAPRSEIRKNLILTVQKFTNWVHNCAFSEFTITQLDAWEFIGLSYLTITVGGNVINGSNENATCRELTIKKD